MAPSRRLGAVPLAGTDAREPAVEQVPAPGAEPPGAEPPGGGLDVAAAFDAHAGELLGFATAALGERPAAEDAVQEVFVRAWRARDRYGADGGSVRTWLFAITRNVVVDVHRARCRRPRPVADPAEPDGGPTGGDHAGTSVDRLVVLDALADLTPAHREVVVEVHLAGTAYGDLAERTGVPVATLRTRMFHALRALRRALDEPPAGPPGGTTTGTTTTGASGRTTGRTPTGTSSTTSSTGTQGGGEDDER